MSDPVSIKLRWIGEKQGISEFSQFCRTKTKVTYSQRISQKDYIIWIIVTNDRVEMPDG